MNVRWTTMIAAIAFLPLVTATVRSEDKATTGRQVIRANDGVNLVCDVRGQGDTALVLLHGWCSDREYWKKQMDVFAPHYRVVALDQAGHGESGKDRKQWTLAGLAEDVESVVKALGLKRVILVGHSMGGPVSLAAAKRMPGTVVAVIGVDTLQDAEFKMDSEGTKRFIESLEKDFKGTMEMGVNGLVGEKADPELKQWLLSRAQAQDVAMAVGLMRDMSTLDQQVLFKECKVPIRCINSGGGFNFFRPTATDTNKQHADFDVVTIDNVGHYPMLEKPAEFNEKLQDLLTALTARK